MGKIIDWFKEGFENPRYLPNGCIRYQHGGRVLLFWLIVGFAICWLWGHGM